MTSAAQPTPVPCWGASLDTIRYELIDAIPGVHNVSREICSGFAVGRLRPFRSNEVAALRTKLYIRQI